MELHERIAVVRKAAGLTQEQLGEKLGVTRQAVSKWESAQATPDAQTIARLCTELQISADYLLLGKEPEAAPSTPLPAVICPCCGTPAPPGTPKCQDCAYDYYPIPADDEKRYAVILLSGVYSHEPLQLMSHLSGQSPEACRQISASLALSGKDHRDQALLRRGLPRSVALHIAARLSLYCSVKVVADDPLPGHTDVFADEETLERAPEALQCPYPIRADGKEEKPGLGFWGIVGAMLLALLIASLL